MMSTSQRTYDLRTHLDRKRGGLSREPSRAAAELEIANLEAQLAASVTDDAALADLEAELRRQYTAAAPGHVSDVEWQRRWPDILHRYRLDHMAALPV